MKGVFLKNLNGRKVLILFILTNIVYTIMLTVTIPEVVSFAGGMKLLDMMPTGYTHQYVNTLSDALGAAGRHAYLFIQIPVDMVYPFFFGVSYSLVLAYLLNKINKLNGNLFYLCYLPLFAALFDYFENLGIIFMLKSFPDNSVLLSHITNVFSILKSSFTTVYFIILIVVLITIGLKIIMKRNTNTEKAASN